MLGYGIVFITHSETVIKKNPHTNEDMEYIRPALNKRAMASINKLVDIICYLETGFDAEGNSIRRIITRETPSVFAGSRFRYLKPSFPFGYQEIVNAVNEAIDMEAKMGAIVTDEKDTRDSTTRPFSEAMKEAEEIWAKLLSEDQDNINQMAIIIEQIFGNQIKLSTVTENQQELLELVISEFKNLLK